MTPLDCLQERFTALERGDYPAVFSSYHAESPFRRQFPHLAGYLAYAREHLAGILVHSWACLKTRRSGTDEVECLLRVDMSVGGDCCTMVELATLIRTGHGWRYHSAEKLDPQQCTALSATPETLDFSLFDRNPCKVRF
jgi:SEC-C motif-containing protein